MISTWMWGVLSGCGYSELYGVIVLSWSKNLWEEILVWGIVFGFDLEM